MNTYTWLLVIHLCAAGKAPPACDAIAMEAFRTPEECLDEGAKRVVVPPNQHLVCERRPG